MSKFALLFTIIFSLAALGSAVPDNAPTTLPEAFWKKPAIQKKLKEREVIVGVTTTQVSKEKVRFAMTAAGHVNRSREHCYAVAQEYPKLKEVSSHFKTLNWNAEKSELFMVTEALGFQARMIMKMTPVTDTKRSAIGFEVIWGHFTGMKGEIGFDPIDSRSTEMSFRANYEAKELPLPKALMGFALEVINQKVAEKMRSYIETHEPTKVSSATSSTTQ
ncbi:MAG: hypothetical protein V4692_13460 [Bdellovibrionota bacterium]